VIGSKSTVNNVCDVIRGRVQTTRHRTVQLVSAPSAFVIRMSCDLLTSISWRWSAKAVSARCLICC